MHSPTLRQNKSLVRKPTMKKTNHWDTNNSQSTWKVRLFVAAAAASACSIGVFVTAAVKSCHATTATGAFVEVCSQPPTMTSLIRRQKCRDHGKITVSTTRIDSNKLLYSSLSNSRKIIYESPIVVADKQNNHADDRNVMPPLSESDAIRILRRARSSSSSSSTSICRTPLEVMRILCRAASSNYNYHHLLSRPNETNLIEEEYKNTTYSSIIVDHAVDGITPNIAAAALRLLTSPSFLHVSSGKSYAKSSYFTKGYYRWGRHTRRNDEKEAAENNIPTMMTTISTLEAAETNAYERMISQLLKKMNDTMKTLLLTSGNGRKSDISTSFFVPVLVPRRNQNNKNNSNGFVDSAVKENDAMPLMDSFALTDLLHALSNLSTVLSGGDITIGINSRGKHYGEGKGMIEGHLLTNISPSEQGSIMDLFDSVIEHISRDNESMSDFVRIVGPRRLVRDVVRPMADMEISWRRRKMMMQLDEEGGEWPHNHGRDLPEQVHRLLVIVSTYLALPHSLEQLTSSELSETLWALTKLNGPHTSQHMMNKNENDIATFHYHYHAVPQRNLLRAFMKRLRKYPIRSAASGRELVRAMWSVARLIQQWETHEEAMRHSKIQLSSPLHAGRIQDELLTLPIRLPGEGGDDRMGVVDFFAAIKEHDLEIDQSRLNSSLNDVPTSLLHDEATIMFHTLINEIVHPPQFPRNIDKNNRSLPPTVRDGLKLQSLDLGQIADILQTAVDLRISGEDMANAIVAILQYLTESDPISRKNVLGRCRSCRDISRVLFSMQRLRVGTGIFNDAAKNETTRYNSPDRDATVDDGWESRAVQFLGERFLELVKWHRLHRSKAACDGKTLAIALRSGVMMFPEKNPATTAILDAASILILDEVHERKNDEFWSYLPFLSSCNEFEVSSFLFAFAMARRFNQEIFTSLTDQMTEDDILDSCTASSASRTMWACAVLLSQDEADGSQTAGTAMNTYKLIDLFHQLAPLLLSSSLSPTHISGAMWAMARSGYVVDKGVFDHLAQLAASDKMLQRSNTRVVSQALWSCAKMVTFESPKIDNSNEKRLNADATIAITPYINACYTFARFIVENQSRISPKQLSRSIWAVGRLKLSDPILVQEMGNMAMHHSNTFDSTDISKVIWGLSSVNYDNPEVIVRLAQHLTSPTIQEASMTLFALGKLQIYDKDVFKSLYSAISSSPQSSARLVPFSANSFLIW